MTRMNTNEDNAIYIYRRPANEAVMQLMINMPQIFRKYHQESIAKKV